MNFEEGYQLLKEMGYTKGQMDYMWDYCKKKKHRTICQLSNSGIKWSDLNCIAVKTLPEEFNKLKGVLPN